LCGATPRLVMTLSDGQHNEFNSMMVPVQEQRTVIAKFKATPPAVGKFNAAVMCPVFTYMGSDGQPRRVICKGWEVDMVSGGRLSRGDPAAVTLLPNLNTATCHLTAQWLRSPSKTPINSLKSLHIIQLAALLEYLSNHVTAPSPDFLQALEGISALRVAA
jgi:hypothetical protein